jgi:hypothetical protein
VTRQEAFKAMQDGNKVSHRHFTDDEYIYLSDETGKITTEDGYAFGDMFWGRDMFKEGWSFYSE